MNQKTSQKKSHWRPEGPPASVRRPPPNLPVLAQKVVLSGRREKEGADVVAEIQQLGGAAAFIRADVAKDADVKAMVDFTVATYASKQRENTSFIRTRKKSHLRTMAASLTCTYHFPTR